MTKKELAAWLNGREYGDEITKEEAAAAKEAGLVVVFGYSDDNVELRGAIYDEVGASDGTTLRICPEGILADWPHKHDEGWSESEAADYFRRKALGFRDIEAVWNSEQGEPAWTYRTDIPHATFDVMEDGELYCRGIVFSLSDLGLPS